MAINLNKHKENLSRAHQDVLSDKTATNWALFGYEGQTNDLKVVSSGDGGLEEMTEDLNSGKVMYAFVKVDDPKTSLAKHVLINWQGEGANTVRKGICANHLRDIERFFTGAHLTINARNEDEVESDIIINKVSKAGSAYSFKAPRMDTSTQNNPIGSNYQRVNPIKEINATERDQFWMKEEIEEKKRVDEERRRRDAERLKQEEEARLREELAATQRDAKTEQRNHNIDLVKEAEKLATASMNKAEHYESVEDDDERINQSEYLREQRKQEAQDLIAQRTIDARSIFEKNTSAGQIRQNTPVKPVRNSILKAQQVADIKNDDAEIQKIAHQKVQLEPIKVIDEPISDEESDQFSTIKRSPKDANVKSLTSPTTPTESSKNQVNNKQESQTFHISEQQFVDEVIYGDITDLGIQAKALYDYQAADDTEITFDPGDIITNIELIDEGWWQGLGPDGSYGLFPANYVELI